MAGGASIAVGAAGSLLNMGAQQRAAAAQRRQIDMQIKQAKSDFAIQQERFTITKAAAQDMYFRERILLDSQRDLAKLQQQEQQMQQEAYDRQMSAQQEQLKHQAEQHIQQLLQSKANATVNAELATGQVYQSLAQRFMQSEELGNQLYRELESRGIGTLGIDEARRLDDIRTLQYGLESANTVGRQNEYAQAQLSGQMGLVSAQANTASSYLADTRKYQQQLNELMNKYGAQDLEYTYQRNLIASEANKYAQQAGIMGQESAAALNLRNQLNQLSMAKGQIQGPNWLGGLLSVGAQFAPQIGSLFQGGGGGSSITPGNAAPHMGTGGMLTPQVGSGIITGSPSVIGGVGSMGIPSSSTPYWGNYNPGILQDVTGNIYG